MASINELPENLLFKIFKQTSEFKNLMLVCRYWKSLLENCVVFSKLKLFDGKRCLQEYLTASYSNRKYKSMSLNIFQYDKDQTDCLKNILIFNKDYMRSVSISFIVTSAYHQKHFYNLLKLLENVEELLIYFKKLSFEDNDLIFCSIKFSKLKRFEIHDELETSILNSYLDWILIELMFGFIEAPQINYLKVVLIGKNQLPVCKNLFQFIVSHANTLETVDVSGNSTLNFVRYQKNKLKIWMYPTYLKEIKEFLENKNRFSTLQDIQLYFDRFQIKGFELFYSTFKEHTCCDVRKFMIHQYCELNESDVVKMHAMFPNLEEFYYSSSKLLSDDVKTFVKVNCGSLKMFNEFCRDSCTFESV